MDKPITVALADDHVLLRKGLAGLVRNFGYSVSLECNNGNELIDKLDKNNLPDIVLMDINMQGMDGFEATLWLKKYYPAVSVLALSMYDDDIAIIRMLKNGAKGYVLKDAEPQDLKTAIEAVLKKGFYFSEMVTGKLVHSIQNIEELKDVGKQVLNLSEREIEFLKLACTEMTYKEMADKMHLSPRTIDGYRDDLFKKLTVKSRVGLVLFAIRHGVVQLD